jgi:hypothetical protein
VHHIHTSLIRPFLAVRLNGRSDLAAWNDLETLPLRMSHLIQLLLPLYDNDQKPFPCALHETVKAELMEKFGGLTTYSRSPAEGLWKDVQGKVKDEIIVYEVMVQGVNDCWWSNYRRILEGRFSQDEVIIRALPIRRL